MQRSAKGAGPVMPGGKGKISQSFCVSEQKGASVFHKPTQSPITSSTCRVINHEMLRGKKINPTATHHINGIYLWRLVA